MQQDQAIISQVYIVPGLPHVLLAPHLNPGWQDLHDAMVKVQQEIAQSDADLILYCSTQWLSVLGYMFQGDPEPEWTHVDANWYEFGEIPYKFVVDADFAEVYSQQVKQLGHNTRVVNYRGFPIDTGTVVAQKLLNPHNKFKAAMVSCNMYAEKDESMSLGQAAGRALQAAQKKAVVVLVSNLSHRFEIQEIKPVDDKISSLKDDEWNRKILDLLGEGRLEDVSQVAREFGRQANGDLGFKGIWWLNGLCGMSNDFLGQVFEYKPVWGTGSAVVGLYPKKPVPVTSLTDSLRLSEEGSQAHLVNQMTQKISGESQSLESPDATPIKREHPQQQNAVMSNKAPEPVGPYPHARRHGDLLFLSGVGPRVKGSKEIPGVYFDAEGNVVGHDIEIQTRSVIENVKTILEDAGSSLEKAIDVQVFLTDMKADFKKFNEVYREYFDKIRPTRTTVEVGSLPTPIAVELKVIAKP